MMRNRLRNWVLAACCTAPFAFPAPTWAKPTAEQALAFAPIQPDVDYDRPTKAEAAQCILDSERTAGATGMVVRTGSGQILRRFLDTNADNKLDQWCYFKDGIEVYRDIDANFNGKADQYRWLGTAGTRWGLDRDEDSRIDSWKFISAEEVTAEITAAVRDRDSIRFRAVLLTADELDALGLSADQAADLKKRIAAATQGFAEASKKQTIVSAKSQWVNFGASRPGTIAAGTDGAKHDLVVYDNVAAVLETDGKHSQLVIGALVKVGDSWKVFDLPKSLTDDATATVGYFWQAPIVRRPDSEEPMPTGVNPALQKFIVELEKVDKSLLAARTPAEQSKLNSQKADLLEQIIDGATTAEDKGLWIRQYAETVNAAIQTGGFPEGVQRLQKLVEDLQKNQDRSLVAYVKFRYLSSEYNQNVSTAKESEFAKLNDRWIKDLESFVEDFTETDEAADAKLQLAISSEFSGKEEEAIKWYNRIAKDHPTSDLAKKAIGAKRRLQSVGQVMTLKGKTIDAKPFDLAAYKGKVVLVHYWATWCEPCKQDMEVIKQMVAKYGKRGFYPIGVSLDSTDKDAFAYLKAKALPWTHLYEPGGLESRPAVEMGILTLPTMFLIDPTGKVVSRSIHAQELDSELGKLLNETPRTSSIR